MADVANLARDRANDLDISGRGVRLVAETQLGIAKLRILSDAPDVWFEDALGISPPPALREIAPGPVACAWLAPGEWLVTGPENDVERVRVRCLEVSGSLGLMLDIGHACAAFELSGSMARAIIASHCPLDMSPKAMPVGAAMRSMFSDAHMFISRKPDCEDQPCFRLIFDQTMSGYATRMLAANIAGECA